MSTTPATASPGTVSLTEVVDPRAGAVRASGHLTEQGADLLRGTVEHLHRSGHVRVLLDLRDVQAADDAGLHVLRDAARSLAEDGGTLLLRDAPERRAR
jgi:anti-anti-sigma regulatory factor